MNKAWGKIVLLFFVFISVSKLSYTQYKNSTEWPYDGKPDPSLKESWMENIPLNFIKANFCQLTFSQDADFRCAKFSQHADFFAATFDSIADFSWAKFSKDADFLMAKFSKDADFTLAKFSQDADFSGATFSQHAYFSGAEFKETPIMEECQFGKHLYLDKVNFEKGADFRRAIFDSVENIYIDHWTQFPSGKFFLYWKQFKGKEKLRIRLSDPPVIHYYEDSLTIIKYNSKIAEIDSILKNNDKVKASVDSLKIRRDSLCTLWKYEKAKLDSSYNERFKLVKNEHYQKIETFYHRLRDNFINQGDKSSADDVTYELGWQREEIKKEWWWKLYGWFFGWGYKPWKFLAFVVVPLILIFGHFWYFHFYSLVALIVDDKMSTDLKRIVKQQTHLKIKKLFKLWEIKFYDHKQIAEKISTPARVWHVIYFSATVLLGIRFKKEWIEKKNLKFLFLVTFEWLLGIGLFVLFAILVKSNQFAYIKGLLGF